MKTAVIQVEYRYLTAEECEAVKKEAKELSHNTSWGSFGPNGDEQQQTRLLCELETSHLENILMTQVHLAPLHRAMILDILKERYIMGL